MDTDRMKTPDTSPKMEFKNQSYPEYLIANGFKLFRKIWDKQTKSFLYEPTEFKNVYSTMMAGQLCYFFVKADIEICWGLQEQGKPATIAHHIFGSDDEMNRFINSHTNEEIHAVVLQYLNYLKA